MPVAPPRGAASLVVVMVLFFLMSLAAAYASRNMVFEQRTSVNQYRSTQAIEAAEAGVEWALSRLNAGRIGPNCREVTANAASTSFRQRYLNINPDTGMITEVTWTPAAPGAPAEILNAACVFNGTDWNCDCPTGGNPTLTPPVGSGVFPAFRVRLTTRTSGPAAAPLAPINRPGVIYIEVNGCTRLDDGCLQFPGAPVEAEGRATMNVMVALKAALATPPSAALTVQGSIALSGDLILYNTEQAGTGITLQAGGPAPNLGSYDLYTIPGSPIGTVSAIENDTSITGMTTAPNRVFSTLLGTWQNIYRDQLGLFRVPCPDGGDCRQMLHDAIRANPDRVMYIEGDLALDSTGDVGSLPNPADYTVAGPAVIVVTGDLRVTAADVRIFGLVYTQGGTWQGSPQIHGGAFVENNTLTLQAGSQPTVIYSRDVLQTLRLRQGTFVRVPGGWRDFG